MHTLERSPRRRLRSDLPADLIRDVTLLERLGVPFAVFTLTGNRLRRSPRAVEILATRADEWGQIGDKVRSLRWRPDESAIRSAPTSMPGVVYSFTRHGANHALVVFQPASPLAGADRTCWKPLTARERQVAEYIARGGTSRDIATGLGISIHTARRHTESLYVKLGVRRRTDVARIAFGRESEAALRA